MSDIHALETNLDLKQNLNVYANCKQLDILHLIFNIFDGGLQADLTNYKVRLKAMKADYMLLIQDTQYTINKNVVTIMPDEQLTTTSGTTKIELQFINTKTGEKKATFNLTLKVIPSVLENERTISTATYTLMDELENKLDKAASFFENINKAIDANTTLAETTNNANTSNTNLNTTISAGNTLKTALDGLNTTANTTKSNLDTSNNNALATKTALDTSNSNAAATKTALDASNTTANTTKSNLDASNSTANSTKTDLDKSNANALATKTDLDKLNTTANVTKADLTTVNDKATVTKKDLTDINTTANSTKTDLDAENVRAEANITAMESFGDITALSKNVTNLRAEVETARGGESDLDGRMDKIATQLSDNTQKIAQLSNPNLLINGDLQIWQRGTSFSSSGIYYSADRWKVDAGGSGGVTHSISKQYDDVYKNFIRITTTGYANIWHQIEQAELDKLKGKTVTLSFYARKLSGNFVSANFRLYGTYIDGNTLTTNWARYVITTTIPLDATSINIGLVNFVAGQGGSAVTWDIAQIKLELGSIATPFVPRLYAEELALCQRYYETIQYSVVQPTTATGQVVRAIYNFKTIKRTTPTVVLNDGYRGGFGLPTLLSYANGAVGVQATSTSVFNGSEFSGSINADSEIY
ncbi:hypothetical protein B0P06_001392 [Clostridium saccharoperbutylacetonicum]|uniref:Uncharacterized protein n=2 Tax=Clostridium saccharoperbutylacetonicum TaxID=36745 RepID=M1LNW5_9CLOT|nr:hypothetical protein [Clostridium saccharoperbutylacetonicum]AGF54535.1 hypothetical protein Cspa_c07580 [Clostridium saccharoperbutylacetonicum N1-4(HMT)]NSB41621.1 hypothetical protein [Clostridium saccharoperbutylacetonicum]